MGTAGFGRGKGGVLGGEARILTAQESAQTAHAPSGTGGSFDGMMSR